MNRRVVVSSILLAFLLQSLPARGANWSLPDLLAEMSAIKTSEAVFRQEVYVSYLTEPTRYKGRVRYRAPDFLRMSYEEPRRDILTFHGDRIRVEQAQDGTEWFFDIADQPPLKAVSQSLRATFSGNAGELKAAFQVDFEGKRGGWALRLSPVEEDVRDRISAIKIYGAGHLILRYELIENDGDRIVFVFVPMK